jgi:transposase
LLRETVRIGCREGFIDLEQVAVDGTILRANAASRSFRTPEKLEKELTKLDLSFEKDVALDDEEDERFGDDDDERKLSGGLKDRKALREKIQAALDEHRATPKGAKKPKQISMTDPEARFIQSKGTLPSYNGQAAVDATSRMVVAGYATNAVGDAGELPRILEQIETNTGRNPKVLAADRGYSGLEGLRELKERGIEGFIPQHADRSDVFPLARFTYVEEIDAYRCPNDKLLHRLKYDRRRGRTSYVCRDCVGCSLVTQCIGGGDRNRTLSVSDYVDLKVAMQEKMRGGAAKKRSSVIRGTTVETIFGHLKSNRGLRQFLLRGRKRVSADWRLELAIVNIERLAELFKLREKAIASA